MDDLYTLRFGKTTTDVLEKQFFGEVDRRGSIAVEVYGKLAGFTSAFADAHRDFPPYMGAQRFRTPRGLDWLKAQTKGTNQNGTLLVMQQMFQQHTTMWSEGIWETVHAENSRTKFIVSDEPVTFYNQMLPPSMAKYPGSEELKNVGTRTIFPLGPDRCVIITHLQYARNPKTKPAAIRENARAFQPAMMSLRKVQYGRQLDENEVLRINLIMKNKATRYIAAGEEQWLYPEELLRQTGWATLDDDWFLLPNLLKIPFTVETIFGHEDGTYSASDAYGRRPGDPKYKDQARLDKEWKSRQLAQQAWAKKRAGKSVSCVLVT